MILARWDPNLAMETVGSWLDLMNANGWIPREQILGWEARSKVPSEFVVQSSDVANPPSLILTVEVCCQVFKLLSRFMNIFPFASRHILLRLICITNS